MALHTTTTLSKKTVYRLQTPEIIKTRKFWMSGKQKHVL